MLDGHDFFAVMESLSVWRYRYRDVSSSAQEIIAGFRSSCRCHSCTHLSNSQSYPARAGTAICAFQACRIGLLAELAIVGKWSSPFFLLGMSWHLPYYRGLCMYNGDI
jgi:hypothetical protein